MKRKWLGVFLAALVVSGCASPPVEKPPQKQSDAAEEPTPAIAVNPVETATPTPAPAPVETPRAERIGADERMRVYESVLAGALLETQNKYNEASQAYSEARDLQPDSPYLSALTGDALLRGGKIDEAIKIASDAVHDASSEPGVRQVLARAYAADKQFDKAIEQYEIVLKEHPEDSDALGELAQIYEQANRLGEAVDAYDTLIQIDRGNELEYRYHRALIFSRMRKLDDAVAEYKRIAEMIPGYYDVYVRIGDLSSLLGKNDDAIEAYLNALQRVDNAEDEKRIRRQLGMLYYQRDSMREARFQFERIRAIDPSDLEAARLLTSILIKEGDYAAASDELSKMVERDAGDFKLHRLQREVLIMLGKKKEAFEAYLNGLEAALSKNSDEDVHAFLTELTYDESLNELKELGLTGRLDGIVSAGLKAAPDSIRLRFAQAKLAQFQGDDARFRQEMTALAARLKDAASANNRDAALVITEEYQYRYLLRYAVTRQGLSSDWMSALLAASLAFPEEPTVLRALGTVQADREEWAQAAKTFRETLALLKPDESLYRQVQFQLAHVYDKQDRMSDLEAVVRDMMQRDPNDAEAYNYLGYAYAERNINLDESLTLIEKAIRLAPNDGNILDSLGWVYFRMGKPAEAIDHLERAATIEKEQPVILEHLGDAYQKSGQPGKAVDAWRKAIQAGPGYPFDYTPEFEKRLRDKIREAEQTP
ncbi:MAG: tetratricopeptide repeat protein [bacterium]|nr:tetratricopeptide repeat protein [bacterium]